MLCPLFDFSSLRFALKVKGEVMLMRSGLRGGTAPLVKTPYLGYKVTG